MKYVIKVGSNVDEIRYLQTRKGESPYWLYEEYRRNATTYETIEQATKVIGTMIGEWLYTTWTILEIGDIEQERYTPIKEIVISEYK
jgi:hypothetical protein